MEIQYNFTHDKLQSRVKRYELGESVENTLITLLGNNIILFIGLKNNYF